ncbi:MAG: hypothetical protein K9M99_02530 [Candidatus Cloacimonetes bacterium]|nr:hypothetical protein [Candidatus Cloacimonadota bacterium]
MIAERKYWQEQQSSFGFLAGTVCVLPLVYRLLIHSVAEPVITCLPAIE